MSPIIRFAIAILLVFIQLFPAQAQIEEVYAADSTLIPARPANIIERMMAKGFLIIPVAFYSPETRIGAGLGGYYYFKLNKNDSITRPSSINMAALYTQNKQAVFKLPVSLAFKENKFLVRGDISLSRYPYSFYGVGNQIDLDSSELYTADIYRAQVHLLRRINQHIFIGPKVRFETQKMREVLPSGRLATDVSILGREGGTVAGVGFEVLFDYRNNIFTPTKGAFLSLQTYQIGRFLGGEYTGTNFSIDARKYIPITQKVSLALQGYWEGWSDDVPFFMLSRMGGYQRLRGYFDGAYRDKHFMQAQAELRFPIIGRFGAVAFGSIGQVSPDFNIYSDYLRTAGGIGLRFLFNTNENINMRFDYAIGKNTSGFYMTVAEAF